MPTAPRCLVRPETSGARQFEHELGPAAIGVGSISAENCFTGGTGNGIMETIRNYGYDIIMLVALLVVASMFIGVCYHAYGTYAEIHTGRKTWGQFGLTVAIGAVLLVIGIWLLTEATGIL